MTISDTPPQLVYVTMDTGITNVNVNHVELLVRLALMVGFVKNVKKTESMPQNVDVQKEPTNVVSLPVAHVTKNSVVSPVKDLTTTVPSVLKEDTIHQPVTVLTNGMKKPITNVSFVWTNVTDVTVMPVIVTNVEVPESTHQIVIVHLDSTED